MLLQIVLLVWPFFHVDQLWQRRCGSGDADGGWERERRRGGDADLYDAVAAAYGDDHDTDCRG